ncbi:MAG: winged helix-turn-helix domain-containing protein [Candidatus Altiarchaeota archaeon]
MGDKITLDRETFKALAADTRVDMLKRLGEHKLTLTDLAQQMGMSPSTIKEHLEKLVEVGLIEQEDKGMKWKYYRLTDKGKNIVSPYETKVWILLGTSLLVLMGSALSLAGRLAAIAGFQYSSKMDAPAPDLLMAGARQGLGESAVTTASSVTTTTIDLVQSTLSTLASAADGGVRMLAKSAPSVNGTIGAAQGEGLKAAHDSLLMSAENAVADGISTTSTTLMQAASTTLQAASTTLRHVTAAAAAQISETVKPAPADMPYLEFALIGLSLIVAGSCTGHLIKRRIRLG